MKMKKKINIVIDASRNRSGGSIVYLINFIKNLNLDSTKIEKVILFSYKDLLKKIPNRSFLIKYSHPFLEKNILFQLTWQMICLPNFLKKIDNNILFTTDSTSFCKYKPSIIFNQDILGFDKEVFKQISFGLFKIRLYLIKLVQIFAMNNASKVIFLSKFSKKVISSYLKKNLDYEIIYHGIDEKLLKLGKKKVNELTWDYKKKNKIQLIYVSPLDPYKNHLTVAKAYSRLKKKYKNLEIKFVGSYKHNIKLYNSIINNNTLITKKNFVGHISHKKVINYIYNSDIYIIASSSETFGISLVEGMALGLPIVCSNKSSLPEILKDGGIYFNPNNDYELTYQIEKYIKNKNLRKSKSKKAFNLSSRYRWDYNVRQFCNLVNEL
jgi:glycosyltransferase involved in cell wall biosynthesis